MDKNDDFSLRLKVAENDKNGPSRNAEIGSKDRSSKGPNAPFPIMKKKTISSMAANDFANNENDENLEDGEEDKEYVATMKEKFLSNQVKPAKWML